VRSPQRSREPGTKADHRIAVTVAVSKAKVHQLTIRREFAGGRLREFVAGFIPSRLEVAPQGSKSLGIAHPRDGLRVEANVYGNVALGNSLSGLKLNPGNFNTEFFEGRNR